MPRDLGDVLHYFLPAADASRDGARSGAPDSRAARRARPALPILSLPIADGDVVRSALAWNLAIEIARRGASASLVAPGPAHAYPVWPEPGRGPIGTQVVSAEASDVGALSRAALDVAVARAAEVGDGIVLVRVPPDWLGAGNEGRALLRWVLLLASAEPDALRAAYGLAKGVFSASAEARVGISIHGVRRIAEAEAAFRRVASAAAHHLSREIVSYGLLVDDLHVYRAIAARRPIGLEHPQSRAARALRDVARLLLEDAQEVHPCAS